MGSFFAKEKHIRLVLVLLFALFALITFRYLPGFSPRCPIQQTGTESLISSGEAIAKAVSFRKPIIITMATGHFFGGNYGYDSLKKNSDPCYLDGIRLNCRQDA